MMNAPSVSVMTASPDACPEIPFQGRTYKVGWPDQDAKARLEKLVAKVAIDEVRKMKDVLDAEAYRETFDAAARNLRAYHTWQPGWQAIVFEPANAHLFLWSLLQAHHPLITEREVLAICEGAPEEVQLAVAQVLPDFFQILLASVWGHLPPEVQTQAQEALAEIKARLLPTPKIPSATSPTPM